MQSSLDLATEIRQAHFQMVLNVSVAIGLRVLFRAGIWVQIIGGKRSEFALKVLVLVLVQDPAAFTVFEMLLIGRYHDQRIAQLMEVVGPFRCTRMCGFRSIGDTGRKCPFAVETAGKVPDHITGQPGTARIGQLRNIRFFDRLYLKKEVVQGLHRCLEGIGTRRPLRRDAQQPLAHKKSGLLRLDGSRTRFLKRVRIQFFLKRFFQRLKGFPACLAENGHKIVCRKQFRRSAFFRGKQQFIPPLLLFFWIYRLNHRVPAAIQHQQITDQNAQFPLDGVGIRVAHADLNAALTGRKFFRMD